MQPKQTYQSECNNSKGGYSSENMKTDSLKVVMNVKQTTTNLALPQISAQSYTVFDMKTGNLILGRKENLKREIASLTKMMTFLTVSQLLERYGLDPDHIKITVS